MPKKSTPSPIHRAIEQLIMEDYEVYMHKGIATLMSGAIGADLETHMLFCETTHSMEILAPGTSKIEIVEKIKSLMKQVELLRERAVETLEGNRVD